MVSPAPGEDVRRRGRVAALGPCAQGGLGSQQVPVGTADGPRDPSVLAGRAHLAPDAGAGRALRCGPRPGRARHRPPRGGRARRGGRRRRSWPAGGRSSASMRKDMEDPDWFFDPVTGRRAPQGDYCFRIDHRSEHVTGNVKQVWELSRLHHLTVLAAAYALSGDERYAQRVAAPPSLVVGPEPVPVRGALDERDRGRAATDHLGLDPAAARRLGRARRRCSSTTTPPSPRSGGTSATWPASAAGDPRPTTTSSPRRPDSSWAPSPSTGSPRASAGRRRAPPCSRTSWPRTPSRAG